MVKSEVVNGHFADDSKGVLENCNAELDSLMDAVLSGIDVGKGKKKKDSDPLDKEDKKVKRDCSHAHSLVISSKIARAIYAWKLKAENILRKKGDEKAEVEETGKLFGGMSASSVYLYRKAGKTAHLLFLSGIKFSELPRSIAALDALGTLNDVDVVTCYDQCRLDYGTLKIEDAENAVAAFMKENPDKYECKAQKPKSKEKEVPDAKAITQKIETVMAEIKVYIATNAKNKAARAEMRTQRDQFKSILKMYESVLVVKTHRSNGNDGE